MRRRTAFTAVLCILLCCCAAVYAETTAEDLLSDYDEALRMIEAYNPFIRIIRDNVADYDALSEEYREIVRKNCRTAGDLNLVLEDFFMRLGNPGHLSMIDAASYRTYRLLAEQGVIGAETYEYRLINDELTQETYASMDPSAEQDGEEDLSSLYLPYVSYDPDRDVLYIRIQSFRHELIDRDRNVLVDAVRAHPDVKHIVFDICGNGGGSDYYWMNILVAPFGEPASFEKRVFFRDDELTREYGYMDEATPVSLLDEKDRPDFLEELGMTHTLTGTIPIEPAEEDRTIHTNARRWVLIDQYVYSAADGFAGFCKQTGWAKLVGHSNTRGDGGASAPFLMRLPKTGLLMRFTATADANKEGKLNTFYGTSPDILPKPSEHPYDTVLRLIDSLPAE